jgi:lipid-binding SYLF domain-containing protein
MAMRRFIQPLLALLALVVVVSGCNTAPRSETSREDLVRAANQALAEMRNADPSLNEFLKNSHGHAIFPRVGAGGFIVGGGWGRGVVFEGGNQIGFADMTQANVGLTAGGQSFSQLIVFQNKSALDRFTGNQIAFDANVSAVALTTGAAATANYQNGVAIFVRPIGGLMVSANLGGQQFRFQPTY